MTSSDVTDVDAPAPWPRVFNLKVGQWGCSTCGGVFEVGTDMDEHARICWHNGEAA